MTRSLWTLAWLPALMGLGLTLGARAQDSFGLLLVIDGAKGDVWKRYAEEGKLPNVKRLFLDGGAWVEHATAVFPTITGAGMPSALTGLTPGRHGIPSLYFFDRETKKYPVLYVPLEALTWNRWLSPQAKTVWEHFEGPDDAIAIGPALTRGADSVVPFVWNVGYTAMEVRGKFLAKTRELTRALTGRSPARLTVVYNGWFDHMEHVKGSTTPEMDVHYKAIDDLIGTAVSTWESAVAAHERRIGRRVERYMVLVSDHGHQDVRVVHSIDDFVRQRKGARVVDKVWREVFGQKLSGSVPDDISDRELLLAAGEGHALLYFPTPVLAEDGMTVVRQDWDKKPPLSLLRRFPYRGTTLDIVAEAVRQPAVSFLLGKDFRTGLVHVYGKAGEATIERQGTAPTRSLYRYSVVEGSDPLGYRDDPAIGRLVDGAFHHADLWQQATVLTEYPDGPVMLYQAFDVEARSPDLYLSAAPFVSIGDLVDGEKSASKHGGLTKDESWATLAVAGTGIARTPVHTARNLDAVATLLWLLQQPHDPEALDGRVVPEVRTQVEGHRRSGTGGGPLPSGPSGPAWTRDPHGPGGSPSPFVEDAARQELERIATLPARDQRLALLRMFHQPSPRLATSTRGLAEARRRYHASFASPWLREVRRRIAENPPVQAGLVEGDREEVARVRHEAWSSMLSRLEAGELALVDMDAAALDAHFAPGSPAMAAYGALAARIEAEVTAFESWKTTPNLSAIERLRRKQAYQNLRERQPTRDQLQAEFFRLAFPEIDPTSRAPQADRAPGFEDLGGN